MKKMTNRFTEWIFKLDQLIENRVQEIVDLNAPQYEMNAGGNESYSQNTSPQTEIK